MYYALKEWMRERGITQQEIADAIGITKQCMSRKMTMQSRFTLEEAIAIKDYVKYPDCIDSLFANVKGL